MPESGLIARWVGPVKGEIADWVIELCFDGVVYTTMVDGLATGAEAYLMSGALVDANHMRRQLEAGREAVRPTIVTPYSGHHVLIDRDRVVDVMAQPMYLRHDGQNAAGVPRVDSEVALRERAKTSPWHTGRIGHHMHIGLGPVRVERSTLDRIFVSSESEGS